MTLGHGVGPHVDLSLEFLRSFPGGGHCPFGIAPNGDPALLPTDAVIQDKGFRTFGGHANAKAFQFCVVGDLVALGRGREVLDQRFVEPACHGILCPHCVRTQRRIK